MDDRMMAAVMPMPNMSPPRQEPSLSGTTTAGKGRGAHSHMVYLRPDGSGVSSIDRGHGHDFVMVPMGNGMWGRICQPGGTDGHTHSLMPLSIREKGKKKDDSELVAEVRNLFKQADELEADSRRKADESEAFRKGDQWKATHKAELEGNQRAALTVNEIGPKLDILSGYQRQNRTDIHYLPVEEGDARVADILNALVKNICEQNNFEYEETQVFEDQMTAGRGNYNVYIDRENNPRGDIVIERYPRKEVWYGPHEKLDASDAEYVLKSKWVSLAWVKSEWPEKADEVSPSDSLENAQDAPHRNTPGQQYDIGTNRKSVATFAPDPLFVNLAKKEYRIIECQRKEYRRVPVCSCVEDDFYANVDGLESGQMASLRTIPCLSIIRQRKTQVRVTTVINDVLVQDAYSDDLPDEFTLIPAYGYKNGKDWWGKVEAAKDPQREINKRHSQLVDILNKVASYGWFYDSNTFPNPQEKEKFKRQSSKPGFVQEINNADRPPKQAEGVKFPAELAGLIEMDTTKIREIMNINPELLGLNSKAESGVAIVEKKRQGLLGNEFLFDNLNLAKKLLGRILVALIRKCYDPDRIMRVLENRNKRAPVEIAGKKLAEYDPQDIKALLEEADLTKYDVVVSESVFSPTTRNANFIAWSTLATQGAPVPISLLVQLSDLPDKQKAMEMIQAEIQSKAEEAKAKYDTEIQKAMIAAANRTGGPAGAKAAAGPQAMPTM